MTSTGFKTVKLLAISEETAREYRNKLKQLLKPIVKKIASALCVSL